MKLLTPFYHWLHDKLLRHPSGPITAGYSGYVESQKLKAEAKHTLLLYGICTDYPIDQPEQSDIVLEIVALLGKHNISAKVIATSYKNVDTSIPTTTTNAQ